MKTKNKKKWNIPTISMELPIKQTYDPAKNGNGGDTGGKQS